MIELIAVGMALLSVFLLQREHVATFPATMIGAALYVYLCYMSGVYADMVINIYFAITALWGWISWKSRPTDDELNVTFLSLRGLLISIAATIVLWICISSILKNFTDSDVYYLNGFNASLGIVAQILIIKKRIDNWYFWIVANIVSVPLYFYKELYLTAFLWLVMLGFSTYGLLSWMKKYKSINAELNYK